ncbi:hypothetical protein NDU88_001906 [Pleurodeles waltl]|uniref:Uncharacterized protein n=1 Tax=Pleurodeles waltl TaxID=8319 RepID=A0AAV7Q8F8_PLEWA|nr:hypothetical protein NDU88_001906 [Pleurodeles waltl]
MQSFLALEKHGRRKPQRSLRLGGGADRRHPLPGRPRNLGALRLASGPSAEDEAWWPRHCGCSGFTTRRGGARARRALQEHLFRKSLFSARRPQILFTKLSERGDTDTDSHHLSATKTLDEYPGTRRA